MTIKELKTLYPEQSIIITFLYMFLGMFVSILLLSWLPIVGNNRKNIPFKNNKISKHS